MRWQTIPRGAVLAIVVACVCALAGFGRAANLSPLGDVPDWNALDRYQNSISRDDFVQLLKEVYAPHGGWEPFVRIEDDEAIIRTSNVPLLDLYHLRFRVVTERDWTAKRPWLRGVMLHFNEPRYVSPSPYCDWRRMFRDHVFTRPAPADKPLTGLRIAIDPGHLGGRWAKMEERTFTVGKAAPVQEGDMTLRTAELLKPRLEALGAEVYLLRTSDEPVTPMRPPELLDLARALLAEQGVSNPLLGHMGAADPKRTMSVQWQSEALFTRAEIRARARRVTEIGANLVVCLHYNAEKWGDEKNPILVAKNHLHVLVNGGYESDEIARDDVRFEMLRKILDGSHAVELPAAEAVATALAVGTGLPPYVYAGPNAVRAGTTGYVWARNLLANRVYDCPVVYVEPYVMNSPEVFARAQAGDYEGSRPVAGAQRQSIFREYADGVAAGLADYARQARAAAAAP